MFEIEISKEVGPGGRNKFLIDRKRKAIVEFVRDLTNVTGGFALQLRWRDRTIPFDVSYLFKDNGVGKNIVLLRAIGNSLATTVPFQMETLSHQERTETINAIIDSMFVFGYRFQSISQGDHFDVSHDGILYDRKSRLSE